MTTLNYIEKDEIYSEIKLGTKDLFRIMTFDVEEIEVAEEENVFLIKVKMENPKMLIGERGQTLLEIQYILRLLLRKKIQNDIFIELDINDYKKKKKEVLYDIAKDIGNEVAFYKREKVLPPMNPYERRIIHLALKERGDVETESAGEGANRKVIVKPV